MFTEVFEWAYIWMNWRTHTQTFELNISNFLSAGLFCTKPLKEIWILPKEQNCFLLIRSGLISSGSALLLPCSIGSEAANLCSWDPPTFLSCCRRLWFSPNVDCTFDLDFLWYMACCLFRLHGMNTRSSIFLKGTRQDSQHKRDWTSAQHVIITSLTDGKKEWVSIIWAPLKNSAVGSQDKHEEGARVPPSSFARESWCRICSEWKGNLGFAFQTHLYFPFIFIPQPST